jgi:hypothetical protein
MHEKLPIPTAETRDEENPMKYCIQVLWFAVLLGCDQSMGGESPDGPGHADAQPSRKPTSEEMLEATGGDYVSPKGILRECLGRLVFDIADPVQWPTFIGRDAANMFSSMFSDNLYSKDDAMVVQGVHIAVVETTTESARERIRAGTPWARIERHDGYIKERSEYLGRLHKLKEKSAKVRIEIEDAEIAINEWEKVKREMQDKYERVHLPLAKSEAYWTSREGRGTGSPSYSIYRAYLTRGEFVFVFESVAELSSVMTKQIHNKQFLEILAKFRPRNANEIPAELGLCVPYGFIADDGRMISDIKQSIRWRDAPGVLYTIQTGNSTPKNTKTPALTAIATAMAAKYAMASGEESKPELTHQIGPTLTKIGGLPASQGGFALKITRYGQPAFEVYDVFTGYSGWWGTSVLPFVLVEMSTRTIEQMPELKQNPPPFRQSMDRLDRLLKSTHLRSTSPLMPEFAAMQKQER